MRYHFIQISLLLIIMISTISCSAFNGDELPTLVPTANEFAGPPGTQFIDDPWENATNFETGLSIEHPQDWNSRTIASGLRVAPNIPSSATGDFRMAAVASLGTAAGDEALTAVIETLLTSMSAGQPDLVERIEPISTSSINEYSTASTLIQITLPDLADSADEFAETDIEAASRSTMLIVALRGEGKTVLFIGTTPVALTDIYRPIFDDMVQTIQLSLPQTN